LRILICLLAGAIVLLPQRRKNEEPKTQVLPLPPELPMAVAANTHALDFHISPMLKTGRLSTQIHQSLADLIRDTRGETIIKLRAFVSGAGDARRVQDVVGELFTEHRLPLPVVSVLQVGALADDAAQVVIEAVVETKRTPNPNGLAFWSGQTAPSFTAALQKLENSVETASVPPDDVLTCTCFTTNMNDAGSLRASVQHAFPKSEINVVQALREPYDNTSSCEAVGKLPAAPTQGPVVLLADSRAALVDADRLVFTGVQLTFGNYLDDASVAYHRLERAARALDPIETPVVVNVFSLDASTASALRKTLHFPNSTFTVQPIEGLTAIDASAGIEAVLAANVANPVILKK
jgi:enamine deaminase RidA (YjgF/YER057c/UK114 family)